MVNSFLAFKIQVMAWEVGERFRREGTNVYLQLIHVDVWQTPTVL